MDMTNDSLACHLIHRAQNSHAKDRFLIVIVTLQLIVTKINRELACALDMLYPNSPFNATLKSSVSLGKVKLKFVGYSPIASNIENIH